VETDIGEICVGGNGFGEIRVGGNGSWGNLCGWKRILGKFMWVETDLGKSLWVHWLVVGPSQWWAVVNIMICCKVRRKGISLISERLTTVLEHVHIIVRWFLCP
jgi:hypothetical protein